MQTDWIDLYQFHHVDLRDAVGGDLAGLRDARRPGQGPLRRLVQPRRLADRRGQRGGRPPATSRAWSASSRTTTCSPGTSSSRCCPAAQHYGVGIIPWSPLAGGLLAGVLEKAEGGRRSDERTAEADREAPAGAGAVRGRSAATSAHAPADVGAGLAAAPAGGDRADRRPAHHGAARGRAARRWSRPGRRAARPARRDLPRLQGRARWSTPGDGSERPGAASVS